jgi:hypothetical protein
MHAAAAAFLFSEKTEANGRIVEQKLVMEPAAVE